MIMFRICLFFVSLVGMAQGNEHLLLITGCARSATTYISKVMEMNGLQFVHEGLARDGCSSWTMAVDAAKTPWGPGSKGLEFKHIFHQVRNPLSTISSVNHTEGEASWKFICEHVPEISLKEPQLHRCVKYWIYWNQIAENKAEWTYRIEDLEKVLPEMSERLGVPLDPISLKLISKITFHRGDYEKKFTWRDMREQLPKKLLEELYAAALHYGYAIED